MYFWVLLKNSSIFSNGKKISTYREIGNQSQNIYFPIFSTFFRNHFNFLKALKKWGMKFFYIKKN